MKTWCANTFITLFTATKNKRKDSFYNKHYGLYNVVLGEDEDIFVQKITSIGVTTMDLKWHSSISTDVALVKSATQESTGFFSRLTKNNTITKSKISRRKTKAVKKFKPIDYVNINIKSDKHRCLLNLPNLVLKILGRSDIPSKK